MSFDGAAINSIARLARLRLSQEETQAFADGLGRIIGLVDELSRIDTTGVQPMAHPLAGQSQRLRVDAVTETDHHEQFQRNAPQVAAGLYLVPRVIE